MSLFGNIAYAREQENKRRGNLFQVSDYSTPVSETEDTASSAFKSGMGQMGSALRTSFNLYTGDDEEASELAGRETRQTPSQMDFHQAIADRTEGDESWWGTLVDVIGAAIEEPKGAFHSAVQQIPNMVPSMGTMGAMGWAGAKAGTLIAPGYGTVVGGIAGAITGLFAGSVALETGSIAQQDVAEGKPFDSGRIMKEGALKAVGTTTADTLMMALTGGAGKMLFGPSIKASSKAIGSALKAKGINPLDDMAVRSAFKANPALKTEVLEIGKQAAKPFLPSKKATTALFAGGTAGEMFSEGFGEYAGETIAGREPDKVDAVLEGLMGGVTGATHTAIGVSAGKAVERAKGLLDITNITEAENTDDAIKAFTESTDPQADLSEEEYWNQQEAEIRRQQTEAQRKRVIDEQERKAREATQAIEDQYQVLQRERQIEADKTIDETIRTQPQSFGLLTQEQRRQEEADRRIQEMEEEDIRRTREESAKALEERNERIKTGYRPFSEIRQLLDAKKAERESRSLSDEQEEGNRKVDVEAEWDALDDRKEGGPQEIADWILKNAQVGDKIQSDDGSYYVVEKIGTRRAANKKGRKYVEILAYNEDGEFLGSTDAFKVIEETEAGSGVATKSAKKNTALLKGYDYTSYSTGERKTSETRYIRSENQPGTTQPPPDVSTQGAGQEVPAPAKTEVKPWQKPNVVFREYRDMNGNVLGYLTEPYDGTKEGARKAAKVLEAKAFETFGDEFSDINSRIGATDESAQPKFTVSPNLKNISDVKKESDAARYTWGDLTTEPTPQPDTGPASEGKQPWEMTEAEYVNQRKEKYPNAPDMQVDAWKGQYRNSVMDAPRDADIPMSTLESLSDEQRKQVFKFNQKAEQKWFDDGPNATWRTPYRQWLKEDKARGKGSNIKTLHRKAVQKALAENKPVPENVLKDYPELAGETQSEQARKTGETTEAWLDRLTGGKKSPQSVKAAKLKKQADKIQGEATQMLSGIPAGQPIHSVRDRNLRDKARAKTQKAAELYKQAEALEDELRAGKATPPPKIDTKPEKSVDNKPEKVTDDSGKVDKPDIPKEKYAVYPVKFADGTKYAVRENLDNEQGFGDSLHDTKEEAETFAQESITRDKANREFRKEQDKKAEVKAQEEQKKQAEKEDIDGFDAGMNPMSRGKAIKVLNSNIRADGKVSTLKELVKRLVSAGEKTSVQQENKIKPMTRRQFNRATQREQDAHDKRVKESGKKSVYYVGGYDLGKIAYDYANHLINQQPKPDILTKSGKPFGNAGAANMALRSKKLSDTHEVVEVDGGYVGRVKATPEKAEQTKTPSGTQEIGPNKDVYLDPDTNTHTVSKGSFKETIKGQKEKLTAAVDDAISKTPEPKDIKVTFDKPFSQDGKKVIHVRGNGTLGTGVTLVNRRKYWQLVEGQGGLKAKNIGNSFLNLRDAKAFTEAYLKGETETDGEVTFKGENKEYEYTIPNSRYHLTNFRNAVKKSQGAKFSTSQDASLTGPTGQPTPGKMTGKEKLNALYQANKRRKTSDSMDIVERDFHEALSEFDGNETARLVPAFTKEQKQVKKIAESFGRKVYFFTSKSPVINRINGFAYKGNTYINRNASEPLIHIVGHETLHQLSMSHPDLYKFLLDHIKVSDKDFKKFYQRLTGERKGQPTEVTNIEAVYEELLGDFAGDQFLKSEFWQKMSADNPTFTQRIVQVIQNILRKIQGFRTKGEQYVSNIQESQDALVKVLREFQQREGRQAKGGAQFQVAYHGGPNVWQPEPGFPYGRPRLDKIGTGEGAAAYGWGWYSAESEGVGSGYQKALSGLSNAKINGIEIDRVPPNEALSMTSEERWSTDANRIRKAIKDDYGVADEDLATGVETIISAISSGEDVIEVLNEDIQDGYLDEYLVNIYKENDFSDASVLYKLDIPDPVIPKLLDWDSRVPKTMLDKVKAQADKEGVAGVLESPKDLEDGMHVVGGGVLRIRDTEFGKKYHIEFDDGRKFNLTKADAWRTVGDVNDGSSLYRHLKQVFGTDKAASEFLARAGIPGNRYLDGMSRGKGKGSYNYVIWDQSVLDKVALLERNGEALKQMARDNKQFTFAGPEAATADKSLAWEAQQMRDAGESRTKVWKKTGWWEIVPGSDVWAWEIDDSKIKPTSKVKDKLKNSNAVLDTVGEVIKADDLFKAYPALKDVIAHINIVKNLPEQGEYRAGVDRSSEGLFSTEDEITVRAPDLDTAISVMLHEIQHAIQQHEGFAYGGSVAGVLTEKDKGILSLGKKEDQQKVIYEAQKRYQRLTGEAQSRLTQRRLDMTPAQRKLIPPWKTLEKMLKEEGLLQEGQKPEDVLISRDGSGVAMSFPVIRQDKNENHIVYETDGRRITVDKPGSAGIVTMWAKQNVKGRDYWRKAGTLYTNTKTKKFDGDTAPKEYLSVSSISIEKPYRGEGLGKKMYQVLMDHAPENIAGIISYTPNRVNKKQVPSIYRSLGAIEKADGDYQVIPIERGAMMSESIDQQYLTLAKDPEKNREALQRMVDDAAREAGYTVGPVYHGTDAEFTEFDTSDKTAEITKNSLGENIGSFFATKKKDAADFGKNVGGYFIRLMRPKTFKTQNEFREFMRNHSGMTPDVRDADGYIIEEGTFKNEMLEAIESDGYDGIIIENPEYSAKKDKPWYVLFSPEQSKSADPITYDSQNNPIPLSQRFNPGERDIRYSTDADRVSPGMYARNRQNKKDIKTRTWAKVGKVKGEIKRGTDKFLGAISTRLKLVNPKLSEKVRRIDYDINRKSKPDLEAAEALFKKTKSMNRDDMADWDLARKNGDKSMIDKLTKKYGIEGEYKAVRDALDQIRKEAIEVGYTVGEIEEYWPRVINDQEGFLKAINRGPERPVFTDALKQRAKELGMTVDQMPEDLKADIISNVVLGKYYGIPGPGAVKQRVFDVIPDDLNIYYMDSNAALVHHIHSMRKRIEARRFFGKLSQAIAEKKKALRTVQSRIRTMNKEIRNTTNEAQADKLRKRRNDAIGTEKELSAYIEKAGEMDEWDEHIGAYINELIAEKAIKPEQENIVRDILMARFNERGTRGLIQAYKNFSYLDTMGSPISAVTQIGDLAWAAYENGLINALRGAGKALFNKSRIKKEDVGITRIAQEFADSDTLSNLVQKAFKWVGLEKIDAIGKDTLLNAAFEKYKKKAKKNPAALKKELRAMFENETDSVVQDLLNNEVTENVKYLVYNRLLDFQPVALSEMPEQYLVAGNGRIFYMLKSFTIKQLDVFRREIYQDLKHGNAKQKTQAMQRFLYLGGLFVLANAGADEIKDWMLGRKTDLQDRVVDNVLRLFGLSKYITWQARTEGVGTAMAKTILPPFKFVNSLYKDVRTAGDDKGLEVVQSIPVIGKLAYWHMGRGTSKREDLWDRRFRKEKARLNKQYERYQRSENKTRFRLENITDLRQRERVNALQGKLNKYRRRINQIKGLPDTGARQNQIDRLEEKRTSMIQQYFERKNQ